MKIEEQDNQTTRASLELLYNISREVAAALDLRTVLQRVLFLSIKNVQAVSGSIIVLDAHGQPVESAIITGLRVHSHTTQQLRIIFERGLAGWVFRNRQATLVPDTTRDDRWLRRPDDAKDRTGAKSAVSAPILAQDKLVGVVTLVHTETGFFTEEHLHLVQAIADQAGIAILNARLYAESQRQANAMTALAESANVINASLKQDEVIMRILEQVTRALRVEVVSLALIDNQTNELVFHASTGEKSQSVVGLRLGLEHGIAGWVATHGKATIVPETRQDPRFFPDIDQMLGFKTRAIACAPIRLRGAVIGVLEALNPIDHYFEPDALVVLSGIGNLAGTAIRHAQLFEQIEAAHQRYRELFEDSIEAIVITDWQGQVQEANRQANDMSRLEKETLHQLTITDLGVVDQEQVGKNFQELHSGETISYESKLVTEYAGEIPVQVYVREVYIEGVSHLQWILQDITERKNLDNLRNDLLSMIYHDLRSPLANVVSSLDVLETMMPLEDNPTYQSLLNIAVRSTERIQRLTNSLLDIRQLEAGSAIINRECIDPSRLIHEAIEAVQPIADGKTQTIDVHISPSLPEINVDIDMIRRVIINLLENASKYTPIESWIGISGTAVPGGVEFCIEDNGPGIEPVDRDRIFDKFTRLQTINGPKGIGLGLAFCRLAIEKHGGKIWVESRAETGARFKFVLPTREVDEATSTPNDVQA